MLFQTIAYPLIQFLVIPLVYTDGRLPCYVIADGLVQMLIRLARSAAMRCEEGNDGLALEIVCLEEGVDDVRSDIPPDGETYEHHVILLHIVHLLRNGRTAVGVFLHFVVHTCILVSPIYIRIGVGLCSLNLEEVGVCLLGYFLCIAFCCARIREIGYQYFLCHVSILLLIICFRISFAAHQHCEDCQHCDDSFHISDSFYIVQRCKVTELKSVGIYTKVGSSAHFHGNVQKLPKRTIIIKVYLNENAFPEK